MAALWLENVSWNTGVGAWGVPGLPGVVALDEAAAATWAA